MMSFANTPDLHHYDHIVVVPCLQLSLNAPSSHYIPNPYTGTILSTNLSILLRLSFVTAFYLCASGRRVMASQSQWNADDAREALLRTEQTFVRKVNSAWSGFIDFALRDNVLEVAVGLM